MDMLAKKAGMSERGTGLKRLLYKQTNKHPSRLSPSPIYSSNNTHPL